MQIVSATPLHRRDAREFMEGRRKRTLLGDEGPAAVGERVVVAGQHEVAGRLVALAVDPHGYREGRSAALALAGPLLEVADHQAHGLKPPHDLVVELLERGFALPLPLRENEAVELRRAEFVEARFMNLHRILVSNLQPFDGLLVLARAGRLKSALDDRDWGRAREQQ